MLACKLSCKGVSSWRDLQKQKKGIIQVDGLLSPLRHSSQNLKKYKGGKRLRLLSCLGFIIGDYVLAEAMSIWVYIYLGCIDLDGRD